MSGFSGTSAQSAGGLFGTAASGNKSGTGGSLFGNTSTSGFSFGQPSTSGFGGNNDKKDEAKQPTGLFGSGTSSFGQPPSGNAGNASSTQKPGGTLFGSAPGTTSTPQPSIFGQAASTGNEPKPSLFGQQSSGGGGSIFGKTDSSAKPSGSLFGGPANSSPTPGTPSQSTAPKSLFGSTTPAPSTAPGGFGGPSTTPAGQPPTSMLGASTGGAISQSQSQSNTQAPSTFGLQQTSTSNTRPTLFGSASGNANLFGAKPVDSNPQSAPNFGGGFKLGQQNEKAAESAARPDAPKFSFPTTTNAPTTQSAQAPGSLFSGTKTSESPSTTVPPQAAAPKPTGFSFQTTSASKPGQPAASNPPAFSGFNLNTNSSDKPSLFAKPATPSTQPTETPKTSASLFPSLGQAQTSAVTSQLGASAPAPAPASSSLFSGFGTNTQPPNTATTAASATASAAPAGLFNQGTVPTTSAQQSTGTAAPTSLAPQSKSQPGPTTTAASGPSTLGASTTGPVAPTQSRLRNRTMDEILTRWASDLTRYTKEFKAHAEQIAHWDQIIVDNSAKIDKLYVKTRTCEKQTMSVEMQLSAVENQQNELESWLSKYEGDVEEMLAKDNSGQNEPGGPDQERERTYQLAEKLGERLDDMGRDLQSMIEEVNAANAGLGKSSKVDEPVTQIVKILNAHLSQLQAIDQGTAALQAKVSAAQKASSGMNYLNRSMNGDNRGAVDDFYRSYMGRR